MIRSFRDPAGSCWLTKTKVYRILDEANGAICDRFLNSTSGKQFLQTDKLIGTRRLSANELAGDPDFQKLGAMAGPAHAVYSHDRVWIPSYPYEWPREMLWKAGRLTLELARSSLADGFQMKDATPYNVLFRGPEPVFIDVPSFEPRVAGDPVWRPYAQFVRTFLLPLLGNKRWGLDLADIFLNHRDGLEPEAVYQHTGALQRLTPGLLSLVSLPVWLNRSAKKKGEGLYQQHLLKNTEKADFILDSVFKRLEKQLERLRPDKGQISGWSEYMSTHSYDEEAFGIKEKFVREFLGQIKPETVLDAGANTGHFSVLAAKEGARVLALDLDSACIGRLWQRAAQEQLNILPLVVNLSRPSPALGWRNQECPSFLERATGEFDCVLMLALIHHLLVSERIPLSEIISLAAQLSRSSSVIELVLPEDPMFQQIARGRMELHKDFNAASFEKALNARFSIVRKQELPQRTRCLYALKLKL